MLGPCTKSRPWLSQHDTDPSVCPHQNEVRALQRGATNSWFSVVRSALAIGSTKTPVGQAISTCDPQQLAAIDSLDWLKTVVEKGLFPALEPFSADEVWETLQKMRGEVETSELDLRWPEWGALRDDPDNTSDADEFFLEAGEVPKKFRPFLERIVLVRKLKEVRALTGFSRIETLFDQEGGDSPGLAPLSKRSLDWLPAIEVRGEGLFIELVEQRVQEWESTDVVSRRMKEMAAKYSEWQRTRGDEETPFPGPRYVLLHSLAHGLIRELSLDCGYSASSVRERIYSSTNEQRRMCGILLYTASPDSEGSLGGLVDLGTPQRFPGLLDSTLASGARCSSDPLCADHQPALHATLNAAACHACLLLPETSCEGFNRFLDRNVLVPTIAHDDVAFFRDGEV